MILENKPEKSLDMNALRDLGDEALPNNRFDIEFTPRRRRVNEKPFTTEVIA